MCAWEQDLKWIIPKGRKDERKSEIEKGRNLSLSGHKKSASLVRRTGPWLTKTQPFYNKLKGIVHQKKELS